MSSNFIQPSLVHNLTIDEALKPKEDKLDIDWYLSKKEAQKPNFTWDDLFGNDSSSIRAMVLGEPGSGKSTLLKQIFKQAGIRQKEAAFIPLTSVEKDMRAAIEDALQVDATHSEETDEGTRYRTKNFKLENESSCIVCFDALDEVSEHAFNRVIDQIKSFCNDYPDITILVSCRKHYLSHSHAKLRQLENFSFISVLPFNTTQIREFLKGELGAKATPDTIEAILQKSTTNAGNSILTTPRYLKVFSDLLSSTSLEKVLDLKRADLFEKAIYHKLETEILKENQKGDKSIKPNEGIITKRVLEKLALVMEIYQRNKITKEELVTFMDETSSNTNLIFLNHLDIDIFITRVLKNIEDNLEFDNTEFQEYLAAKELLRLGRKSQILYDLIIEPNFQHIHRNWYDVLRYVVEIEPAQVVPLIEHLNLKGKNPIADDFFRLFSTIEASQLNEEQKRIVFNGIFSYFQKSTFYLGYEQAAKLSQFFIPANHEMLHSEHAQAKSDQNNRRLLNITIAVYYLLEGGCLTREETLLWRKILLDQSNISSQKLLQTNSLRALRKFKDIALFEQLNDTIASSEQEVQEVFLFSCCEVAPDSSYTLEKVVTYLKQNREHAERLLTSITGSSSLTFIFNEMLKDEVMLRNVTENFSGYSYHSFENIMKAWNEELEAAIKDLLTHLLTKDRNYLYNAESFIKQMVTLLCQKQETYFFEFLRLLPSEAFYSSYEELLARLLKPHQVDNFVQLLKSSRHREFLAKSVLRRVRYVDNPLGEDVYTAGREHFPEMYEAWDAAPSEDNFLQQRVQSDYKRFQDELGTEDGAFNPEVFSTFYNNMQSLQPLVQEAELQRLKKNLLFIFSSLKVANYRIMVTQVTDTSKNIHASNRYFFSFGLYIRLALDLGLAQELAPYRSKIISYLAVASAKEIELIVEHLGEFTDEDIQQLLDFCSGRTDDLLISSPRGFLKMVEIVQRQELIPILRAFVEEPKLHPYEKEEALECLGRVFPDKQYLQHIFDTNVNGQNLSFARIANAYLISKFKDKSATEWRFDQAKNWRDNPGENGIYIRDWELEAFGPSYFACAYNAIDPYLIPFFQDLLVYTITIRKEAKHLAYSNYLQNAIYLYYDNLKALGSYVYLKDLKKFIDSLPPSSQETGFEQLLRNLELQYIEHIGAPDNMADCVKRYNELKAKTYLPITSVLELRHVIEEVLNGDVTTFIHQEGFYRSIATITGNAASSKGKASHVSEDTIQKTLKVQIENGLLKRGFRHADIIREAQLYDDKRLDLLVSYGFIGPVMLELKLLHNREVTDAKVRIDYKEKLKQYLAGSHSSYGFYVLFKVKKSLSADNAYQKLKEEYKDLEAVTVKKIDCLN
ncbi:NACHT domain-containing protein [Pontibacter ramchanderi]|uniref:NACHT domain-containing protein n=1 Tax=Pontibacter ramchanderi TaxID=1179743 RepID=A0A2N3V2P0_9BACT|nr:NACHT domain-containing protein [Pontibacter ramchanderi]PKV75895.1 NACHT domain-containing protein [Pontibacter ramchanderi]